MEVEFQCKTKKICIVSMDCVPRDGDLFTYEKMIYSILAVGWGFRTGEDGQAMLSKPYVAIELSKEEDRRLMVDDK